MSQKMPFIGPRPFMETDAEVFFGRNSELASLTAEVVSTQIVLLYAPSGSGKSSLINAGLMPAMRDEGFKVSKVRVNTLISSDGQSPVDSLEKSIRQSAQSSNEQPSLLVLDQFEEIIVAVTYAELNSLSGAIYGAMAKNPLARIVISFREEYLARIGALFNKATQISVGHFHLDRLSRLGALEAFERSLATVGVQVQREAGELFLQQLAPPMRRLRSEVGFEPLYLQLLGAQLWSSIANRYSAETSQDADGPNGVRPVVTVEDVRRLVDFDQAIEVFFNSTISRVCAQHYVTEKAMRDWIDRELVTADETRSMVRRQVNETEGLETSVLDDLTELGLLRTEPRGDDLWLELAHDQLVERVREFNRIWWTGRVYTRLRDRDKRFFMAVEASMLDVLRWYYSRSTLWSLSTSARDSVVQLSQRYGSRLPFVHKRFDGELDRLALRAFLLTGTMINSAIYVYRSSTTTNDPVALQGVEGLDAEAAKRKLQATALNLGRTGQLLAAANVLVALDWARLLSRIFARPAIAAPSRGRRRLHVGVLLGADVALTLLRWVVRNGLIWNCLEPDDQIEPSQAPKHIEVGTGRRCMSLEDAAAWSRDGPVLLVLDWRGGVDGARGFERYVNQEVPLYESALKVRGAIAAWCCRGDVRRRGWRYGVSGIGFPSRGQRTYYMVEHGNVVAWRTVKDSEFPPQLNADTEPGIIDPPVQGRNIQSEKRFTGILTSLIVSSEAALPLWREIWEPYFKSVLGRPRRKDNEADLTDPARMEGGTPAQRRGQWRTTT